MSDEYKGLQESLDALAKSEETEKQVDDKAKYDENTPIHKMADNIFGKEQGEDGDAVQDSFGQEYVGEDIGLHGEVPLFGEQGKDAVFDFGKDLGEGFGEDFGEDEDSKGVGAIDFGADANLFEGIGQEGEVGMDIANLQIEGEENQEPFEKVEVVAEGGGNADDETVEDLLAETPVGEVEEPLEEPKEAGDSYEEPEDDVEEVAVPAGDAQEVEESQGEAEKAKPVTLEKDGVTYHTTTGSVREDVKVVTEEFLQEEQSRKEELQERIERAKEKKEQILGNADIQVNLDYVLEDSEGNQIEARNYEGGYLIDVIPIEKIKGVGSSEDIIRKGDLELANLQEDIHRFGLVEPIHVVPYKHVGYRTDDDGNEILTRPIYRHYLILSGRRRMETCIALGYTEIPALVDSTIPPQLIKFYEAITNNIKEYSFPEKLSHANFLKRTQTNLTNDMVENILNWRSGEYLKAQYIDQMKNDYPDIYRQVDTKKLSIEQGFKKLEKEIEKAEKELEKAEAGMSEDDIDEKLREDGKDELTELQVETQQQTVGDRKILDRMVRKSIEIRDLHCQCCGFGKGEEDFMGAFEVHHIIPVQYGGSDDKYNLILLCKNCHKLVHDYERGEFIPSQATFDKYDLVKRIVVLGNMLKRMRGKAFDWLRKNRDDLWNLVDNGKLSVGKALLKAEVDLKGESYFEPTPYDKFKGATGDLDLGIAMNDELGVIEWTVEDEEQNEEIMSYGKLS